MSTNPESPEVVQSALEYLRSHEDNYQSNQAVRDAIRDKSLTAMSGPSGAGKTFLTRFVTELDPDIKEVGSTVIRKLRHEDPAGFVSVTYKKFEELASARDFINYNVIGDKAYGTQVSGLTSDYNVGPILTKSVDTLMNTGLKRFNVAYVVVDGETYEEQLLDTRADFADFSVRAEEGHESIAFARANIGEDWLHLVENSHDEIVAHKAARKIIAITRGIFDTDSGEIMTRHNAMRYLDEMDAAIDRVSKKLG